MIDTSKYDIPSVKRLSLCAPLLQKKVYAAMDVLAKEGIHFRVSDGVRTVEEQDQLYKLGRTILKKADGSKQGIVTKAKGGHSNHNFGCAVDCYPFLKGNSGALDYQANSPLFKKMIQALKAQGLSWGGDWKSIVDAPHFQLANVPESPTDVDRTLYAEGGLPKVYEHYNV